MSGKAKRNTGPRLQLVGKKFNMLTVEGYAGKGKWKCRCDCGNETVLHSYPIQHGIVKSCGCLPHKRRPRLNRRNNKNFVARQHPEYSLWCQMRARCQRQSHEAYHNYGGRGIRVCDRWQDFSAFLEDMGPRPGKGYTVDRIDNNKNYEPGNCRWATRAQQSRNSRQVKPVTWNGETLPLGDWADRFGVPLERLRTRVSRGMDVESAANAIKKAGRYNQKQAKYSLSHEQKDAMCSLKETHTANAVASMFGVPQYTVFHVWANWPAERNLCVR